VIDNQIQLFTDSNGKIYTYSDVVDTLKKVGADNCDVLFVHSELSFGVPCKTLKRNEYIGMMYKALEELGVKTLIFPTFTFSFSNFEDYDVSNSRSRMGALTEYARKQPNSIRSNDPLMSVVVIGENKKLIEGLGKDSVGKNSIFDKLHNTKNVKFLFFGTEIGQCFTHMHYVEEQLNVPYRYNKSFTGKIINQDGESEIVTYNLFVKYRDIIPVVPDSFEEELIKKGIYKKEKSGDRFVGCFTEKDSYQATVEWLEKDINGFLGEAYNFIPFIKEYSYGNVTTVQ
jgi:aminoglycoside 3-N-acetyltransferase